MDSRFKCIVHHGGQFAEFTNLGYNGLEETWDVESDFWSYFKVLGGLKDLGYPTIESLWYYDQMECNSIVELKDDNETRRMHTIDELTGEVHLYVMHPILQDEVIEEPILSLEYNVEVGATGTEIGENYDEGTTCMENVVNKGDNTEKFPIKMESVMDEGYIEVEADVEGGDINDKGTTNIVHDVKAGDKGTTEVGHDEGTTEVEHDEGTIEIEHDGGD
ncbi:unnamed protein product [Lathyrus sativus]|nr:unnamed protein product [Lathyrus sativus]